MCHNRLNEEAITKLGYFECSVLMEMNIIQFNNFSQKGQGSIYHREVCSILYYMYIELEVETKYILYR